MSTRRGGRHRLGDGGEGEDLMITPLLDLMVALIPFLIFSAVLTKINVVDVGVSRPVASPTPVKQDSKFDLLLRVSESTVEVVLNGKVIRTATSAGKANDEKWVAQTRAALVDLKKANPDEYKIRIEPKGRVTLQTLMTFMDAARKLRPEDGEILRKDEKGKPVKLQYLFPNVILRGVYS